MNAREIAALVEMPRLLQSLGVEVNERTRRAPCILHGGSNPSAFAWTEGGLWKCHSCGAGGDRIALVRAVRKCDFREAVQFLACLAGVEYLPERFSREEFELAKSRRERVEKAAWRVRDEGLRLLSYYADGLRRSERLMAKLGEAPDAGTEAFWEHVAKLAWPQTFFLAAYLFISNAKCDALARFVLASPAERRKMILEGSTADEQRAAA